MIWFITVSKTDHVVTIDGIKVGVIIGVFYNDNNSFPTRIMMGPPIKFNNLLPPHIVNRAKPGGFIILDPHPFLGCFIPPTGDNLK